MAKERDDDFVIPEWRVLTDEDFKIGLKEALHENDHLVIPKVIRDIVEHIGVEKTAELSGLSVINVNKSISLAKVQKELEPIPDPYKLLASLNMDIRGLFEYAQKMGREIKDLPYVDILDFVG